MKHFSSRHIGPDSSEKQEMIDAIGVSSIDNLIDKTVPIGKPGEKENFSPLSDLKYATWYIVSGGGGAPYYNEEPAPWNKFWKLNKKREENNWAEKGAYYYSSQENIFIFDATKERISMTVFNPYGEKLDFFPDLMISRKN